MRLYEPKRAISITKSGPDYRYVFRQGEPVGPKSREDEMWMDRLVVTELLKCVKDTNPGSRGNVGDDPLPKGINHTKLSDFVKEKKEPLPHEEGYKTKEEREAELAVAEAKKKANKKAKETRENLPEFKDEEIQKFFNFVMTLKGKNTDEMSQAIDDEYFKKPLVALCEKLDLDDLGNKPEIISRLLDFFSTGKFRDDSELFIESEDSEDNSVKEEDKEVED
ncbi:MAG: hypothetical protein HKP62_02305 [Sulfurovum sp.]|nr:hypothetical protein [Sulfurovum sp.]NNJ44825.1 hypothetical protein [Sulfurovum sp.]